MSEAIRVIVDVHVRFKDRNALEALRDHRQRLRHDLQQRSGGPFDVGQSIRLLDDDLTAIETGLQNLG